MPLRSAITLALCTSLALAWPSARGVAGATWPAGEFSFADLDFEQAGSPESLPAAVITALAQDSHGWIWIGTPAGLVRHDGYRFHRFNHADTDSGSLAGDYVNALWAGRDGKVWVGTTSDGLSVFDPRTGRFSNYRTAAAGATAESKIWALAGDAQGGVWVGTNDGLDYWPQGAAAPQRFRHDAAKPGSLADNRVRSLLVDRHGTLWVGLSSGLQRRTVGSNAFETVASSPADPASLAKQDVRALFEASDGKLWIGTREHGAAWLAPGAGTLHRVELPPGQGETAPHRFIRSITEPLPGQIWLGTFDDHGIDIVDARNGDIVQRARHEPSNAGSLALDSIGALLVDRAGLMWVGTWGNGLQRHHPGRAVRLLRHTPARPAGLSQPDVRSVLELADGRLLVGTGGNGIDILDRRQGLIGGYRPRHGAPGALGDGAVSALAQTADGAIWAGTPQAGVFRLPPGSATWQSFGAAQGLPHANVRKLLVARDGTLWAGTDGGVARWLPQQQRFDPVKQQDGGKLQAVVYALSEDAQGTVWVGTGTGLWFNPPGASGLALIQCRPPSSGCLASGYINGLLADDAGQLWVATAKGLDRLARRDGENATFEHVSAMAGRAGKYPGANLLQDKPGRIWTQWQVFTPAGNQFTDLARADGIDIGTSWDRAYARTRDGLFLFGGTRGLAVVDPQQFKPWSYLPAVQVSEVMVDGVWQPWGRIAPRLTVAPGERSFSLNIASDDYSAPLKSQYAYRLEGYDKDWITLDAEHRTISYGNLWHGDYVLRVRAANRSGLWNPNELTVPITVLPVFWKTSWFMALVLLGLTGGAWLAYRWRVARLRANAAMLAALVQQRTTELEQKNIQLEKQAVTDRLTGLYNRLKLDQVLEQECLRSERYNDPLALLLLDLDKFKLVNDMHGHQAGDQVLVALAQVLTANTREVDLVGRWGGEEFLVVASSTTLEGGRQLAEKIRDAISRHDFPVVGHKTTSIGVAAFHSGDTPATMVARADAALYRAKDLGRNRVEWQE